MKKLKNPFLGYTVFTYFYVLNYLLKRIYKWCEYNPTVENSTENWKVVCKLASIIQTTVGVDPVGLKNQLL